MDTVESSCGMFFTPYPTLRATICRAAGLGVNEDELETRPTDAIMMVGGTGAAGPVPDLRHQQPGQRIFIVKKVGIGIHRVYIYI